MKKYLSVILYCRKSAGTYLIKKTTIGLMRLVVMLTGFFQDTVGAVSVFLYPVNTHSVNR